jgi:DNA-binding transcriptional LysR family regulator
MDRLEGIAAFSHVVETGSFTAAAERLKLSKSAVSAHVQRLEERLGVRLLHRTTRRVTTTEAGQTYHQYCARILADAEAAERAASALQSEPRGTLRVSAPGMFGSMHVAAAIAPFRARFPEISIDLRLDEKHVNLVDDRFDLAIRVGTLPDSPLVVRKLAPSRMLITAAPDYLKRNGEPLVPDDLRRHPCLCFSPLWPDGHWRLVSKQREERVPVAGAIVSNNGEVIRVGALAGVGVAILPAYAAADALSSGKLKVVLPGWGPPLSTIHAVYVDGRRMSAKVRLFVDHLARYIGRPPFWERAQ